MRDNPWRRLVTYLLTTFAITWICWGATALLVHFTSLRAPRAALYFLLCALLQVAAFWLSSHGWSAPADSAGTSLIAIVSIFLVVTLVAGGNEECGWRGIMQPLLAIPAYYVFQRVARTS